MEFLSKTTHIDFLGKRRLGNPNSRRVLIQLAHRLLQLRMRGLQRLSQLGLGDTFQAVQDVLACARAEDDRVLGHQCDAPSQLGRVHLELVGEHVDHAFDEVDGLGDAEPLGEDVDGYRTHAERVLGDIVHATPVVVGAPERADSSA